MLSAATLAACAATNPDAEPASGFVVLGAASLPEFEGADAQRTVPFVVARYLGRGLEFELDGLQARLDVATHPVWRAGPLLSVTLPRTNEADSAIVARLPERDLAVEVGGFVGFRIPIDGLDEGALTGTFALRRDATSVHDGILASAKLDGFFAPSYMFRVGASVQATATSGEYQNAYFTVNESDATVSGLPVFDAGSGLKDVTGEVYSILSLSERLGVFSRVAYARLLGDAADSPIVHVEGDADQWFVGLGMFWRF